MYININYKSRFNIGNHHGPGFFNTQEIHDIIDEKLQRDYCLIPCTNLEPESNTFDISGLMISDINNNICQVRIFTNSRINQGFACGLYDSNNNLITNLNWIERSENYEIIYNPNGRGILYIYFEQMIQSTNLVLKNIHHSMQFHMDIPVNDGNIFESNEKNNIIYLNDPRTPDLFGTFNITNNVVTIRNNSNNLIYNDFKCAIFTYFDATTNIVSNLFYQYDWAYNSISYSKTYLGRSKILLFYITIHYTNFNITSSIDISLQNIPLNQYYFAIDLSLNNGSVIETLENNNVIFLGVLQKQLFYFRVGFSNNYNEDSILINLTDDYNIIYNVI